VSWIHWCWDRIRVTDEYRLKPGCVSKPALAQHRLDAQRFKSASQLTTIVIGGAFGSLALIAARKRWPFDTAA
jgi:hypothetical protein